MFIPTVGPLTPTPTIGALESNAPPIVSAGSNKLAVVNQLVHLRGTVTDDGKPGWGRLTSYWSIVGGPTPVTVANPSQLDTTVTFPQPGTYVARLTASDSELTTAAEATVTVRANDEQTFPSARSTRGTEFWLTFPGIGYNVVPTPTPIEFADRSGAGKGQGSVTPDSTGTPITDAVPTLAVVITAEDGATGTVQMPGASFNTPFNIAPGGSARVVLPAAAMISRNDFVENKGVFVQSDRPATVFAIGRRDLISLTFVGPTDPYLPKLADSVTAHLVYPVPSLGTQYRVVAPGTFYGSGFTIVATEDDTVVTVDLVVSFGPRQAGNPFTITLQRGQTYQLRTGFPAYGEQTGTILTSTKRIMVVGGNDFTGSPLTYNNAYASQMLPTTLGADRFFTRPLDPRSSAMPYDVTIMALDGEASVFLNGEPVGTTFDWFPLVLSLTGPNVLQTDRQVQVVQSTRNVIQNPSTLQTIGADSIMTMVPGTANASDRYVFTTLTDESTIRWATVMITQSTLPSLRLNGAPVDPSAFQIMGETDTLTGQIPLSAGSNTLTADRPFTAWISAYAPIKYKTVFPTGRLDIYLASYATPAGLEFGELEADSVFTLVNDPQIVAPGQTATVTTRVVDASGRPLGGVRIDYAVSGVNAIGGRAYTDFAGYASFRYTGASAGTDLIVAAAGSRGLQGQVQWTFGGPPATPTPLKGTPTPLPTRLPIPTVTPTPTLRPGTPTRTPTPVPGFLTPTPTPLSVKTQFANIYFFGQGAVITIFRGQPLVASARVDRFSLLSDFYIEVNGERLPNVVPDGTPLDGREGGRWIRWFPRVAGDYVVRAVGVPIPGVTVNEDAPLTVRVIETSVDPALPIPPDYSVRAIGPTEVAMQWPSDAAYLPGASMFIERRRLDQAEWRPLGYFDYSNSSFGGNSTATGRDMRFVVDRGLEPSTDYVYRFSYLTPDGRVSPTSPELPAHTLAPFPRFAVVDLTAEVERYIAAQPVAARSGLKAGAKTTAAAGNSGVANIGEGRPIAINSKVQVVLEQVINGVKTYWFWDPETELREIPGTLSERGKFVATGLAEDGMVSGRWDTGERNGDGSVRYHAAVWSPLTGVATDLTRMTPAALAFYFDEVDFRDLPNAIPMSWTANGVDSNGEVSGMVTLNRGHTPPGGNVYRAARWKLGEAPELVKILPSLPGADAVMGFNGSIYAMTETGAAAGSALWKAIQNNADQRNQADHNHAFYSPGPGAAAIDLGTGGGWHSEGWGINQNGQVAGVTTISQNDAYWRTQAFITDGPGVPISTTLPTLGGTSGQFPDGYSFAKGVNDDGWVVGQSLGAPVIAPPLREGSQASYGCLWKKNALGFYEVMPLHKLTAGTDWVYDIATAANKDGVIGAVGFLAPKDAPAGGKRAVVLFPAGLVVDANRDGRMSDQDDEIATLDQTDADHPYLFWVNNDRDGVDADLPVNGQPDFISNNIPCARDLEDYSRLWIRFKGVLKLLRLPGITLRISWLPNDDSKPWQTEDGAPAIKIFPAAEADGGNKYLTDVETAGQQLQPAYALTAGTISWNNPLIIQSTDYIVSNINDANSTLHLLFEGAAAGRGQIVMQILRNNKPFVDFPRVYLDIRDIKNLYERWSVDGPFSVPGEGAEPQRVATISKRDLPAGQTSGFQYRTDGNEAPDSIVFVHGWNLNAFDKDADAETAFKRLFWQGFRGKFFAFQWPTTYGLSTTLDAVLDRYNYDNGEHIAWKSAQPLAGLLGRLQAVNPGRVYMFGHSMGNVVCGEALRLLGRTGAAINTYAALEAAIQAECYDPATALSYPLHYRYTHPRIPGNINYNYDSGIPDIFGNWLVDTNLGVQKKVSYHNVNDYALYEDFWEFNQISKPDDAGTSVIWGWGGVNRPGTGLDLFWRLALRNPPVVNLALGNAGDVRDRYEIMAHISEPRSRALGRTPGGILGFRDNNNLQDLWPPDNDNYRTRPWHSAQFRFTIIDQRRLWRDLLIQFDLLPTP